MDEALVITSLSGENGMLGVRGLNKTTSRIFWTYLYIMSYRTAANLTQHREDLHNSSVFLQKSTIIHVYVCFSGCEL